MTGDPHESKSDWLQRARLEFKSNAIIFHDETFVKMATVEDILNRLSEERQRCYRAHSDAETKQQESSDPCIKCVVLPKYPECPNSPCIKKRDWIDQHNHDAAIAQAAIAEHDCLIKQTRDHVLCFYENPDELQKFVQGIKERERNETLGKIDDYINTHAPWLAGTDDRVVDARKLIAFTRSLRSETPEDNQHPIQNLDDVYREVSKILPKGQWYRFEMVRSGDKRRIIISDEGF